MLNEKRDKNRSICSRASFSLSESIRGRDTDGGWGKESGGARNLSDEERVNGHRKINDGRSPSAGLSSELQNVPKSSRRRG